jgi:phospholipid/cholesterol/gamma-HCH transport system substrate-binding protein
LAAAAIAIWGYYWLTAQPLGQGSYPLVVQLPDAGGLQRGDRVRLAGVQVGTVRSVGLRRGAVLAEIAVDPELALPRDSRASLQSSGAFGGRYLSLEPGKAAATLRRGDTLTALKEPTLSETFEVVGTQAAQAFARASDLLSPELGVSVDRGVRSVSRSADQLSALTLSLRATATRLRNRLEDARLDSTVTELTRTAHTLTGASAELHAASMSLGSILNKIDRGDGSLGRAVNDPTLYEALVNAAAHADEAAVNANALVRDFQARPDRYIRLKVF